MTKAARFDDLLQGSAYVDCYVSTDSDEIDDILAKKGFREDGHDPELDDAYGWLCTHNPALECVKTGLQICCTEIPLDEALRAQEVVGFPPMAKMRIYTDGRALVEKDLLAIMKAMLDERQNVAFMNESHTRTRVFLSEYYH